VVSAAAFGVVFDAEAWDETAALFESGLSTMAGSLVVLDGGVTVSNDVVSGTIDDGTVGATETSAEVDLEAAPAAGVAVVVGGLRLVRF
jgi:hypothetical protein